MSLVARSRCCQCYNVCSCRCASNNCILPNGIRRSSNWQSD